MYKYLLKHKESCSFRISFPEFEVVSSKEMIKTVNISNVSILFKENSFSLSDFSVKINIVDHAEKVGSFIQSSERKITKLTDLLYDKEVAKLIDDAVDGKVISKAEDPTIYFVGNSRYSISNRVFVHSIAIALCIAKVYKLDVTKTVYAMICICNSIKIEVGGWKQKSNYYDFLCIKFQIEQNLYDKYMDYSYANTKWNDSTLSFPSNTLIADYFVKTGFKNLYLEDKSTPSQISSSSLKITSEKDVNISEFIEEIYSSEISKNHIVEIKYLKIIFKEEIKKIKNPDYDLYLQRKKELTDEEEIKKFSTFQPLETLDEISYSPQVDETLVNSVKRVFSNLYLKEKDLNTLKTLITFFEDNNEEMFVSLGIRKKLSIFLEGPPGVGKTTIIETVASILGKNINFVDISKCKTNRQAKLLIDHSLQDNSITVFEDCDVQSKVFHKRETVNPVGEIDDELNLSFLLNIFDGTMCKNGSVFFFSTNDISVIDPALYRRGRVDVIIHLDKCDHYQIRSIFKRFINRELSEEILRNVPEYTFTPADIIFTLMEQLYVKDELSDEILLKKFLKK